MKFYNTLAHQIEEFKPLKTGKVGLYTCGPTVYDQVHIGNFRTYIFEDLLRRTLKSQGLEVSHLMNITDVDDKTIRRSRERYPDEPPKDALRQLTAHYEDIFLDDAKKLGIDFSGSRIIRATEHIREMQELIRQIPDKYISDDGVYFDLSKYPYYGALIKLDRSHEHHRIDNDEYDKEHVADFALWKAESKGEPSWQFDIDGHSIAGRPGWHIECSAMSTRYLGQPFDIHTGGVDLIFPHHENEIAQNRAANQKALANFFIHGEHLLIDGRRMGKSLNNFYAVADLVAKGYDPLAFRLLVLQAHYRSQLNFTWESLSGAQVFLNRLRAWADLKFQPAANLDSANSKSYELALQKMNEYLIDDLNSAGAIGELAQLVSEAEDQGVNTEKLTITLEEVDKLLGLGLSARPDIDDQARELLGQREEARRNANWRQSDAIRDRLRDLKIEVSDTPNGQLWRHIY